MCIFFLYKINPLANYFQDKCGINSQTRNINLYFLNWHFQKNMPKSCQLCKRSTFSSDLVCGEISTNPQTAVVCYVTFRTTHVFQWKVGLGSTRTPFYSRNRNDEEAFSIEMVKWVQQKEHRKILPYASSWSPESTLNLSSDDKDSNDINVSLSHGENSRRGRLKTGAAQEACEALAILKVSE